MTEAQMLARAVRLVREVLGGEVVGTTTKKATAAEKERIRRERAAERYAGMDPLLGRDERP